MVGIICLLRMEVVLVNNGLFIDDVTVVIKFGRILPELVMAGNSLPCGEIRRTDLPGFWASIDCGITMILGVLGPDMVECGFTSQR